jgi:hypothetical protein
MRHYEPIWNQIKQTGYCEISAHKALHRRIIKAIWKEKLQDLAFKQECLESTPPIRCITYTEVTGSVIKFRLEKKTYITLDSI